MKIIRTLALMSCSMLLFTGCKKFLDINDDPNNPLTVKESLMLSPIEAATSTLVVGGTSTNVTAYWMQHLSLNQQAPNLESYYITNVDVNNTWSYSLYTTVFQNVRVLINQATAAQRYEYAGLGQALFAYNLAIAADLWNNIPYSEGFRMPQVTKPKYDSQEAMYITIQQLLDSALLNLNKPGSKVVPEADDYIYNGDIDQWKKLVYTLKARYYLRLSKAPGRTAALQADSALTALAKGFGSNADNAFVPYPGTGSASNPWYYNTGEASGGVVLGQSFVDSLKIRQDPRLPVIATKNKAGEYVGRGVNDIPVADPKMLSAVNSFYADAAAKLYLVTYSEALFIKAEATFIKSGAAAAAPVYKDAIAAHMSMLGVPAAAQQTYIDSRPELTAANAVQQIITEKYIADFLSPEAYNDWRRTGYPQLKPYVGSTAKGIPRRWPYPAVELLTNPQPDQKATINDRVWWDTNN
ncbi:SusD/RagB family nutrient-binding outer membrane lipoprotein [Chitinophaga qingshengii]|uniref:SusD/RagB family nutrient-binding outer membrane lipoprotein n=1 Tax=Chitinophaga qingshengii TaxID=1569794 RepID=A0ABR7TNG2_9BACT|nr:SusD/RagB family nutrient-binding outer membrane lipoprotein [Chitinophaga qingshengii]MBC9932027.1 SusD/RagB family nutrient-binding outer membrane lipoprotein [Chitinophaga qingshengii]